MKYLVIILLFIYSCGSPVERMGGESATPKKELVASDGVSDGVNDGVNEIDDWVLIRAFQGTWKVKKGDHTYDDNCIFEFYYSKSRENFELRTEGYEPKNHTLYKRMSKIIGNINRHKLAGTMTDIDMIEELQNAYEDE